MSVNKYKNVSRIYILSFSLTSGSLGSTPVIVHGSLISVKPTYLNFIITVLITAIEE